MISWIFKTFAAFSAVLMVIGLAGKIPEMAVALHGLNMLDVIALLSLATTLLLLYFLPAMIGIGRGIDCPVALSLVNLLIGWTVLGWLICLLIALVLRPTAKAI